MSLNGLGECFAVQSLERVAGQPVSGKKKPPVFIGSGAVFQQDYESLFLGIWIPGFFMDLALGCSSIGLDIKRSERIR
jgi:hypothetical protein